MDSENKRSGPEVSYSSLGEGFKHEIQNSEKEKQTLQELLSKVSREV